MLAFALGYNLLVFLLACIALMAVFLGARDIAALLLLLATSLPVSLAMLLGCIGWFVRCAGARGALGELWRRLPQWLTVAGWLVIALLLCGELALLVTLALADAPPAPWQHLPLAAGVLATAAFCTLEAVRRARTPAGGETSGAQ